MEDAIDDPLNFLLAPFASYLLSQDREKASIAFILRTEFTLKTILQMRGWHNRIQSYENR